MTVIPCEQDPRLRAEIERFAEVLKTQAHQLGEHGLDDSHTIYAGSLDDPSLFKPVMLLFERDRPDWVIPPQGVERFETMPD